MHHLHGGLQGPAGGGEAHAEGRPGCGPGEGRARARAGVAPKVSPASWFFSAAWLLEATASNTSLFAHRGSLYCYSTRSCAWSWVRSQGSSIPTVRSGYVHVIKRRREFALACAGRLQGMPFSVVTTSASAHTSRRGVDSSFHPPLDITLTKPPRRPFSGKIERGWGMKFN